MASLGAMSAAAINSTTLSSGLAFKDAFGPRRAAAAADPGKLSSFVIPSLVRSPGARRVLALANRSSGTGNLRARPELFSPLDSCLGSGLKTVDNLGWDGCKTGGNLGQRTASLVVCSALASDGDEAEPAKVVVSEPAAEGGLLSKKGLTTGSFFFAWYFLNVIFNILNKRLYNYFPYPYFVSVVHLLVGVTYCCVSWAVGAPKRAPIDKELLLLLTPVSFCHALGHVMTNVSFAAVAVSFTHTVKSLEPFFNAAASQFILGQQIPFSLWLSLAPIVLGVSAASMTELSFNWKGFISAMTANIAFTYRNIYSKKAMTGMDSTNVYAYISILSLLFCIPPAIVMEGPTLLSHGFADAVTKVGLQKFLFDLFWVGMFYHLYNQLANNTLERVAPLTHAVGNVLKRVFVIGFSIIVFGNKITTQTGIGTVVAIAGVAVYSLIKADLEEKRRKELKSAEGASS